VKVLIVNKFYHLSGGAERHVFEWEALLRAHGHEVIIFSMRHPENRPCAQEKYFAEEVRFDLRTPWRRRIRAGVRAIWNRNARAMIRSLLEREGPPDVAHLHSYMFQLTPAILGPLLEAGVPIVQTCHDYSAICVNQHLYDHRINSICEACLRWGRIAPLWRRCMKGSLAWSAAGCVAGLIDRYVAASRERIRRFIAPGEFMRRKLIQGGLPADRVVHIPHFIDAEAVAPGKTPGEYVLFFGRLVPHKGISTFLRAAAMRREIPCAVLGGGVLEHSVRQRIRDERLDHVRMLGRLGGDALWQAVRRARAVVVPSEWYEPFGLVILEAMAAARAVIASNVAGPAELVSHGTTGSLFTAGDAEELAEAMGRLWNAPDMAVAMGERAREKVLRDHRPEDYYGRMMAELEAAMG